MCENWKTLKVTTGDLNELILFKFAIKEDSSYSFMWTSLESLHIENLQPPEIMLRNELLNEALEANAQQICELIEVMLEGPQLEVKCNCSTGVLEMTCFNEDIGIDVQWTFQPRRASSEEFSDLVVIDSTMVIRTLLDHQDNLLKIIRDKDAEIAHLYENGGTLTRKSLKTEPFSSKVIRGVKHPRSKNEAALTLGDPKLHEFMKECLMNKEDLTGKNQGETIELKPVVKTPIKLKRDPSMHPFSRKRPQQDVLTKKDSPIKSKLRKL